MSADHEAPPMAATTLWIAEPIAPPCRGTLGLMAGTPLYALDPALPVLLRPDGAVQVGWDPRRAVLVRPPGGLAAAELAASIRIHGRGPLSDLLVEALRCSGARIAHSSQPHAAVSPAAVDLVVLTDTRAAPVTVY